ncbi:hypothetical protein J437_LFUL005925 [Ladona fulva]|uniref:Uncharacterized protein n=1 Tax=Ladona fulva TaxID=123851 RepID=A0A8K0KBS6_LADFU|nr:hypothetical protein J437_LFUL005925 [Ladona fulva]
MTVLESMAPSDEHHSEPMVIYVQSNSQVDGQMLSLNEDPLGFPEVGSLESLGNPGEHIVTLVDDLGQALGEGQAVPITLSDIGNIDFVDGTGTAFQTEDGQVLYLTYTVDHGSGENQLNDGVTLQANGEVEMLSGLNIPASQQPQQIVLDVSPGDGSYLMTSDANSTNTLIPDNSVPLISIPENKKSSSGKKENSKTNKRNAVDHRKTARVIGPEVHIEDKLQVLEAMVPRVERPKKKKPEPKSVKQKPPLDEKDEQAAKNECEEKSEEMAVNEETEEVSNIVISA